MAAAASPAAPLTPAPAGDVLSLDRLPPHTDGVVIEVTGDGPIERRLRDLGLLPGTTVRALRRAPLGDPVEYELRGYRLCLRRTEASRVTVRSGAAAPGA